MWLYVIVLRSKYHDPRRSYCRLGDPAFSSCSGPLFLLFCLFVAAGGGVPLFVNENLTKKVKSFE